MAFIEKEFELNIISKMLSDGEFFRKAIRIARPAYFTLPSMKWAFIVMKNYYNKYHKVPTLDVIVMEFDKLDENLRVVYQKEFGELPNETEVAEYSLDQLRDFIKTREITKAISEAITHIDRHEINKASKILATSLIDASDKDWIVDDWASNWELRKMYYDKTSNPENVLPVNIYNAKYNLDKCLSGGIRRGELAAVLAPTKRGKSIFLVHIGNTALLEGWDVLHITLETRKELILRRYDAKFLNKSSLRLKTLDFDEKELDVMDKMIKEFDDLNQRLKVAEVPPKKCDVNTIFDIVYTLEQTDNFTPDVIIVDYGDIMVPSRKFSDKRFEQEDIFWDLKYLAGNLNTVVWTATQAKALSAGKKKLSAEDFSESYGKMRVLDALFSMNQTEEEGTVNVMRIGLPVYRDGPSGFEVTVYADLDLMLFRGLNEEDLQS